MTCPILAGANTVCAKVERASHGNLNICHGEGLVYQGTTASDLIIADCLIRPQSVCSKTPQLLSGYFIIFLFIRI